MGGWLVSLQRRSAEGLSGLQVQSVYQTGGATSALAPHPLDPSPLLCPPLCLGAQGSGA